VGDLLVALDEADLRTAGVRGPNNEKTAGVRGARKRKGRRWARDAQKRRGIERDG
jgi:hypothetical protein